MYIEIKDKNDLFKTEVVYQNNKIEELQKAFFRVENYKSLQMITRQYRNDWGEDRYCAEYRLIIYSEKAHKGFVLMLWEPSAMYADTYAKTLYDDILKELDKVNFSVLFSWLEKNIEEFDKILALASRKNDILKEEHQEYLKNALNELGQRNNYFIQQENKMYQEMINRQKQKVSELESNLKTEKAELQELQKKIK